MKYLVPYACALVLMVVMIADQVVADARLGIWHVFEIVLIVLAIGFLGWWWVKNINGIM